MSRSPPDLSRAPAQSDLAWTENGAPRSTRFDDIYFQPGEGLEESRAVFLQGCGLPEAWLGRDRFTVGELGFGTGLNILALLDLWRRERAPGQRLAVFSVEGFPLSAEAAARALAAWPELSDLAGLLLERWPRQARGFHRIDLPELGATLDLAVGEVADALQAWSGRADAWFLDGFSPAKNPQMWDEQVMALVAARSAPGARAATFTVAGGVRRALAASGFEVERRPGHGRKRQRLEARLPGSTAAPAAPPRVAVVGAGIAGASLARAFAAEGLRPVIVAGAGAGASGNPAALVTPRLDAGGGLPGRLHAQALARAVDLYTREAPGAVIARGVLQLEHGPRDAHRFDALAASPLFAPAGLTRLEPAAVAALLEAPEGPGGLMLEEALVVEPAAVLGAWLPARLDAEVHGLVRAGGVWRLTGADGAAVAEADIVCLAAGAGLGPLAGLTLNLVRGQASWVEGVDAGQATAWGGYAAPTRGGLLFGATHDRDDTDTRVRAADDQRNRQTLAAGRPRLAQAVAGRALQSRAAVRAAARDHLPVAGALAGPPGLFVLGAFGGRGFTLAPLLAEHVAALALGAASPLPADLARSVDPQRLPEGSP